LGEDRKWYVASDKGRQIAGPFDFCSEAILAELTATRAILDAADEAMNPRPVHSGACRPRIEEDAMTFAELEGVELEKRPRTRKIRAGEALRAR
jgi:hypothetical protein